MAKRLSRAAQRARDKKYGRKHRQVRAQVARMVATGAVCCSRCGKSIGLGEPWDLDHADDGSGRYLGAAHRRCNRGAANRARVPALRNSRVW